MHLRDLLILSMLLVTGSCRRHENDTKVGDLPDGVIADIHNIIMNGAVKLVGDCPPVNETDVTFYLYNRENLDDPIIISKTNMTSINPKKRVIFLIHGWISSAFTGGLQALKDAYLQRYDWNVIAIDWSSLAKLFYVKAFCDIPSVSDKVSDFLCEMSEKLNITLASVRMVGHSLGAHISGMAGERVQQKCQQKLERITGLDPAGPMYNLLPKAQRLDETDAKFVDILHTNAGQFGYVTSLGTVDFYVNCGSLQPHCPGGIDKLSPKELLNLGVSVVTCPHTISWYYMAESINDKTDKFKAFSCTACLAVVCLPNPLFPKYTVMGENTPVSVREAKQQQYISIIMKSSLYKIT